MGVGIALLATHWTQVWADIKKVVSDAVDWVKSHLLIVSAAFGPLGLVVYAFAHNWSTIWEDVKTVVGNAVAVIVHIIKGIADTFMAVVGAIIDGAAKAFGWVPGVGGKLKAAAKAFDGFRSDVDSKLSAVANDAANWGSNAGGAFGGNFRAQANAAFASVLAQTHNVTAAASAAGAAEKQSILDRRAGGGPVDANTPYLVGEHGPEVVVPNQAGTVLPHSVFAGTGGGTALASGTAPTSGSTGNTTINIEVKGTVISQGDLIRAVRTGLLQRKNQTGSLGLA